MKHYMIGLAAALAVSTAGAAGAAEVSGANVGVSYSGLTGSANDATKLTANGSMEVAFSPAFSVQGDMAYNHFGDTGWDGSMFGLHGIYHPMMGTSLGAFVGRDRVDGSNLNFYGLEAGREMGLMNVQGYIWHTNSGDDGTAVGLSGDYALNNQFAVGGRLDVFNGPFSADFNRVGVTGTYKMTSGYSVYGEVGRVDAENADAEGYLGVGVRATFGPGTGTSFAQRGLLDMLPGL